MDGAIPRLSRRQREVLELIAGGKTNDEISVELDIETATVNSHAAVLRLKLGAKNRAERDASCPCNISDEHHGLGARDIAALSQVAHPGHRDLRRLAEVEFLQRLDPRQPRATADLDKVE